MRPLATDSSPESYNNLEAKLLEILTPLHEQLQEIGHKTGIDVSPIRSPKDQIEMFNRAKKDILNEIAIKSSGEPDFYLLLGAVQNHNRNSTDGIYGAIPVILTLMSSDLSPALKEVMFEEYSQSNYEILCMVDRNFDQNFLTSILIQQALTCSALPNLGLPEPINDAIHRRLKEMVGCLYLPLEITLENGDPAEHQIAARFEEIVLSAAKCSEEFAAVAPLILKEWHNRIVGHRSQVPVDREKLFTINFTDQTNMLPFDDDSFLTMLNDTQIESGSVFRAIQYLSALTHEPEWTAPIEALRERIETGFTEIEFENEQFPMTSASSHKLLEALIRPMSDKPNLIIPSRILHLISPDGADIKKIIYGLNDFLESGVSSTVELFCDARLRPQLNQTLSCLSWLQNLLGQGKLHIVFDRDLPNYLTTNGITTGICLTDASASIRGMQEEALVPPYPDGQAPVEVSIFTSVQEYSINLARKRLESIEEYCSSSVFQDAAAPATIGFARMFAVPFLANQNNDTGDAGFVGFAHINAVKLAATNGLVKPEVYTNFSKSRGRDALSILLVNSNDEDQ